MRATKHARTENKGLRGIDEEQRERICDTDGLWVHSVTPQMTTTKKENFKSYAQGDEGGTDKEKQSDSTPAIHLLDPSNTHSSLNR